MQPCLQMNWFVYLRVDLSIFWIVCVCVCFCALHLRGQRRRKTLSENGRGGELDRIIFRSSVFNFLSLLRVCSDRLSQSQKHCDGRKGEKSDFTEKCGEDAG